MKPVKMVLTTTVVLCLTLAVTAQQPQNTLTPQDQLQVDKDRIEGSAKQAKGKVKEWAGKVTGDSKTEAEGKADQFKGKVQNTVGGIKDSLRGK